MLRIALRNLFQNKVRLVLAVGGVALALMLILALDAVVGGMEAKLTAYIDYSGADIFVAQSGARKHEDIMRSIELFGTTVLPEFKERHAEHQEWRRRQLEGVEFPVNSSI